MASHISVEDARKAVQLVQFGFYGVAQVMTTRRLEQEKLKETFEVVCHATLKALAILDLYLTGSTEKRRTHKDADSVGIINLMTRLISYEYPLSAPNQHLILRWPKKDSATKDVVLFSGDSEEIASLWDALFTDSSEPTSPSEEAS